MKKITVLLLLMLISCQEKIKKESINKKDVVVENNERTFSWDFSKFQKCVYDYKVISETETTMNRYEPNEKMQLTLDGQMEVEVVNSQLCNIRLVNFDMERKTSNQNNTDGNDIKVSKDLLTLNSMRPDGRMTQLNSTASFNYTFPIPYEKLEKGQSSTATIDFEGVKTMTFKGYETYNGRSCAVLTAELTIPDEGTDNEFYNLYEYTKIGSGTYYFDLDDQIFIGGNIETILVTTIKENAGNRYDFEMFKKRIAKTTINYNLIELLK